VSEAFLPWHPLALITAAVLAGAFIAAYWQRRETRGETTGGSALRSLAAFTACFFLLIVLSGLGGRPRNGLLLAPTFGATFAYAVDRASFRLQRALLAFLTLWSAIGISHILMRTGLTKATMIDRPEQVLSFIRATQTGCSVVVTYDPLLAFSVSHSQIPRVLLLSAFTKPIAESAALPSECSEPTLYVVHSYIGGGERSAESTEHQLDAASHLVAGQAQRASFSFDPDAARKRRMSRLPGFGGDLDAASRLPDYRYTVVAGPMPVSDMPELRSRLPHFCTPDECRSPISLQPR
jgi:hypothetical protein